MTPPKTDRGREPCRSHTADRPAGSAGLLDALREAYEAGKLAAYFDVPERSLAPVPPVHEGWHH